MKKIEAVIQPFKGDEVKAALTARAPQIVEAIAAAARCGKIGDGKIFVSSLEEAVRIRDGDRGESAL